MERGDGAEGYTVVNLNCVPCFSCVPCVCCGSAQGNVFEHQYSWFLRETYSQRMIADIELKIGLEYLNYNWI